MTTTKRVNVAGGVVMDESDAEDLAHAEREFRAEAEAAARYDLVRAHRRVMTPAELEQLALAGSQYDEGYIGRGNLTIRCLADSLRQRGALTEVR